MKQNLLLTFDFFGNKEFMLLLLFYTKHFKIQMSFFRILITSFDSKVSKEIS